MIRAGLLALLLLFPATLRAEISQVFSGEHAGFSRLVIQLPAPAPWILGKTIAGFELRIADPALELDTTRIFSRIPRSRITNVGQPGPGRLSISLGCDCPVDSFELRPGRIVIDVRDGPDPSPGKLPTLPPLPEGLAWSLQAAPIGPQMLTEPQPPSEPPAAAMAPFETGPSQSTGSAADDSRIHLQMASGRTSAHESALKLRLPLLPHMSAHDSPGEAAAPASQTRDETHPTESAAQGKEQPAEPGLSVESALQLIQPQTPQPGRARQLRNDLLRQLSKASAEGLFEIPLVPGETEHAGAMPGPTHTAQDPSETDAKAAEAELAMGMKSGQGPGPKPAANPENHIEIQTAADLGRQSQPEKFARHGEECFASEIVDVANWGPARNESPFANLRTRLVGEFDKPDPAAVEALIRRYLYFGFGAEARQVLDAWDTDLAHRQLYSDLAALIDNRPVEGSELKGQSSCETDIALWALLAAPQWPAAPEINRKAVSRAFSALPPHLRRLLGPRLADGFIGQGDLEMAATLRDQILRAPGDAGEETRILEAHLAEAEGRLNESQAELTDIARSGGVYEAEALASLIETRLEAGEALDDDTALLADAMAVEYQDTEAGSRLLKAAVKAIIATGHPRLAFERIEDAASGGGLDPADIRVFRSDAHAANAKGSDDVEFLKLYNEYGPLPEGQEAAVRRAHVAVAQRLVDLGLPETALNELNAVPGEGHELALLRSRALLAMDRGDEALRILSGIEGEKADRLRIQALEQTGRFAEAARLQARLDPGAEAARLAWQAGDWQEVARLGQGVWRDAAMLMLSDDMAADQAGPDGAPAHASPGPDGASDQAPPGGLPAGSLGGDTPSLTKARALLESARQTSDVLQALLASK